jgi:hypothetical protein
MLGSFLETSKLWTNILLPLEGFGVPKSQDRAFEVYRDLSSPNWCPWSLQQAGATIYTIVYILVDWTN